MKIFFAAGDAGGARALLPVATHASDQGCDVWALDSGIFRLEGADSWRWLSAQQSVATVATCDALFYATSVADDTAVRLAAAAKEAGAPCIHLLDNWANYRSRLMTESGLLVMPDIYAVMDDLAATEARAAGVSPEVLRVTGHPGLAYLVEEVRRRSQLANVVPAEPKVVFISEPAGADGVRIGNERRHRGYDEGQVLAAFYNSLADSDRNIDVTVVAHPREDRQIVARRIADLSDPRSSSPAWKLAPPGRRVVRDLLHASTHVVGMSSILLYEAWLLGKPTLSLQPGLTGPGLRTLASRPGVVFHDDPDHIETSVTTWLRLSVGSVRAELQHHSAAAETLMRIAYALAAEHASHFHDRQEN